SPTSTTGKLTSRTPTRCPGSPRTVSPQPPASIGAGADARTGADVEPVEGAARADGPPPTALTAHSNVAAPATVVTLARVPIGASESLCPCLCRQGNDHRRSL